MWNISVSVAAEIKNKHLQVEYQFFVDENSNETL